MIYESKTHVLLNAINITVQIIKFLLLPVCGRSNVIQISYLKYTIYINI